MILASFSSFSPGSKKITRLVRIQSEHITRCGTWTKPSSRVPSRSNSPGHHPQWVLARPRRSPRLPILPPSTFDDIPIYSQLLAGTLYDQIPSRKTLLPPYPISSPSVILSLSLSPASCLLPIFDPPSLYLHLFYLRFNISPFTANNLYADPREIFVLNSWYAGVRVQNFR